MGTSRAAEKRMLAADEFETVSRTHHPEIRKLSRKDLSDLLGRLRDHRKAGTAMKSEVFAGAVKRLNREIARHDSAERRTGQSGKSRHALELKQAGDKPDRPKAGRAGSRGMKSIPSEESPAESKPRRDRKP